MPGLSPGSFPTYIRKYMPASPIRRGPGDSVPRDRFRFILFLFRKTQFYIPLLRGIIGGFNVIRFVKVMAKESVYTILDLIYRLAEIFIEWYYDKIDGVK